MAGIVNLVGGDLVHSDRMQSSSFLQNTMLGFAALLCTFGYAAGQACDTTTLTNTVPTDGTGVALQSYSYCGKLAACMIITCLQSHSDRWFTECVCIH